MTTNLPYSDPGAAAFEDLGDFQNDQFLLLGQHPKLATFPLKPTSGVLPLAPFTVVTLSGGKIAAATSGVPATGVLMHGIPVGGDANLSGAPVAYSGNFNIDALVWDASFDTDAKKLAAFTGSTSPTQIVLGKRDPAHVA